MCARGAQREINREGVITDVHNVETFSGMDTKISKCVYLLIRVHNNNINNNNN